MTQRFPYKGRFGGNLSLVAISLAAVAGLLAFDLPWPVRAQSTTPDWQTAAGGKMAFDVASVKQNTSLTEPVSTNVPFEPGDAYRPTGGLFSGTNVPLITYIEFAYKLTMNQYRLMQAQLPKAASVIIWDRFDIQARVDGNPTKDQMRLMLQSLLADRFKMAIHYETWQLPVYALALLKPGKTGPQLRPYSDEGPCSTVPPPPPAPGSAPAPPATVDGGFPVTCGDFVLIPASASGRMRFGARNVPIGFLVEVLPQLGNLDRPVVDQTGLGGTFDLTFEWTHAPPGHATDPQTDESGPAFPEDLKEQLGLKLEKSTGPVEVFVIDHVEEPSKN